MKWLVIFYFLCCNFCISRAQEFGLQNIGFDWGLTFMDNELSNTNRIRGDVSSGSGDNSTNSLSSFSFKSTTGIKSEIYFLHNKLGLSAGIKYSRSYGYAGKWGFWSNGVNFFYWNYRQEGVNTEYLRVKRIYQMSDYIGLPLEVRFFPARRPHLVQVYLKTGTEVSFRIRTKTNIVFWDETMNSYEKEVASQVEKPGHFGFSLYECFGLRFGRNVHHAFSIEALLPGFNFTSGSSGLLKTLYGGGIQFHLQVPIQSNNQ